MGFENFLKAKLLPFALVSFYCVQLYIYQTSNEIYWYYTERETSTLTIYTEEHKQNTQNM